MDLSAINQWHSWSDFFAMGGYAFYVWWSFGLTAFCMAFEVMRLKQRTALAKKRALYQERDFK